MTAYSRRFVLSTAALLIAVFTSGIGASPDFRPFSATLDGFAGPAPTADPCILANTEHGTGNARHMGAIAWASTETVNLCSNPAGGDVVGELTITAANGDSLHFSYTTLAHFDFAANQVSAAGNWQIASGTGRFAGATGQGVITANGSLLPPFEVIGRMTGVIAY
jgi:hypothetical protein